MITTAQKKKLKVVFKKGYAKEVQQKLTEKGIVSRNETPYGISFITHVFNGRYENFDIEETIIELYQVKLAEAKEIIERRKRIFDA
jgi:hypothetical protein